MELAWMEENLQEDIQIPATVSLDSLTAQGTLAFRGGTSLFCEKKSWHIRLEEDDIFPHGGRILLNAQYRDPSLMRNTLGMAVTAAMGFPAPETEFVTLRINGENMGVYERVERIDRRFYQRNGLDFGPLFKGVDTMGRLVCHFSDTSGTAGLEPKVDSEPYTGEIIELIEACFRGDVSSLETTEFLAAFAVNTAISDRDGIIKNFYLHEYMGVWHYYPWDRDATFGNSWMGDYDPNWTGFPSMNDIGYFGASGALLSSPENVLLLNEYIEEAALVMAEDLPGMVDSIRLHIRNDLAEDPYYLYSTQQFDSLCLVLSSDIQERAGYLQGVYLESETPVVESLAISSCLDMADRIEITLSLFGPPVQTVVLLVSFDGAHEEWQNMLFDHGEGVWRKILDVPPGTYSVGMAFGPVIKPGNMALFYPSWALRGHETRPVPAPGARVSLAELSPELLSPGRPVWCGENLWVLPVTNEASFTQDLSLCGFLVGDPPGTVFLPESILIQPGETFYLTSNAVEASRIYNGPIFGEAGTAYPSGTTLTLNDPSWNTLHSWSIQEGDSLAQEHPAIIPSELNCGPGVDWIELYNNGLETVDLSGWYLMDGNRNVSMLPENLVIHSGHFLVASDDYSGDYPDCQPVLLNFSLNSAADSLLLFNGLGERIFSMGWNEGWPTAETGLVYLNSPLSPYHSPAGWTPAEPPGTPGMPNPGWIGGGGFTRVSLVSGNPCSGSFSFFYETSSMPAEAILYDMAGRVVSRIDLPQASSGTVHADFSRSLPSGVYIVYLRSSAGWDSVRLTVLTEE